MSQPKHSPWGAVDYCRLLIEGIYWVGTPSHGGAKLDRQRNALIPKYMRTSAGWYEEDCDWAIVATVFPAAFPEKAEKAKDSLRNWHPHEYAQFYGVPLESLRGQSYKYDQECFHKENADKWVALSCYSQLHADNVPDGMIGVICSKGGRRQIFNSTPELALPVEERYFLTSEAAYDARSRYGYVVQESDSEWSGPERRKSA